MDCTNIWLIVLGREKKVHDGGKSDSVERHRL